VVLIDLPSTPVQYNKTFDKKYPTKKTPRRKQPATSAQNLLGSLSRYTQPRKRTHTLPIHVKIAAAEIETKPSIKKIYGGLRN
jgi:hypothetical protein